MLDRALEYAADHRYKDLAGLVEWLRLPSISTLAQHSDDVMRAAEFACRTLVEMGMHRVEIRKTPGHPVVYAEWLKSKQDRTSAGQVHPEDAAPTLLIYGHFDVQPVDPIELWQRPPFEPVVEGDNVYARGASDDKGQAYAVLCALRAYLRSSGALPVNIKILLEGEEEITSPNLPDYIRQHADELSCDAILIADQDMLDSQHPVIMWGLRGQVYLDLHVCGPQRDLHSGTFGGAVDNPLNVLVRLLAALQDGNTRRILIPGFYDSVAEINERERELISQAPITDELGLALTGAPALGGEVGYGLAERVSVRPTLEIHGISGGFTGEGSKTIIPSSASAKLGMRLVPAQNPTEIAKRTEQFLRSLCPPTVQLEVKLLGQASPVKIDYTTPAVQAAARAYELGFGYSPVYLRGGGSLPIVHDMIQTLSGNRGSQVPKSSGDSPIPVVMIGFGLPDDGTHAPNEKFYLPNFYNGIKTVIHYLDQFRRISQE